MTPGPKNGQKNFGDPWGSKMTREPIIIKKKLHFQLRVSGLFIVYYEVIDYIYIHIHNSLE